MYDPRDLASFSASEFQRGLVGLTDEESRRRFSKADGAEMNSASWTVAHVAAHWALVTALYTESDPPMEELERYLGPTADPEPPALQEACDRFDEVTGAVGGWIQIDGESMTRTVDYEGLAPNETASQALMRVILHTWFHIGEINAIRQLLGHPEIEFVGYAVTPTWKTGT